MAWVIVIFDNDHLPPDQVEPVHGGHADHLSPDQVEPVHGGHEYDCDWCNFVLTLKPEIKQHTSPVHDDFIYNIDPLCII